MYLSSRLWLARTNLSIVEEIEIVGSSNGDDVVLGVPRSVQDLLGEVELVDVDLVFKPVVVVRCRFGTVQNGRLLLSRSVVAFRVERGRLRAGGCHAARLRRTVQVRVDHDAFRPQHLSWLRLLARALVHQLLFALAVERFEEVVV